MREKWERHLNTTFSILTRDYLSEKYPVQISKENTFINGRYFPVKELIEEINKLKPGEKLISGENILAFIPDSHPNETETAEKLAEKLVPVITEKEYKSLTYPWTIFQLAGYGIEEDFKIITKDRKSQQVSETNTLIGTENIFIEEGARVEGAILNGSTGPIYIGKDAEVGEGSVVRGPLALCDHSYLKLGAKVYGPTIIGPHSKVGGEVNNVVFLGYSNKAHDGFLGNAVIGEWCNLGADTNCSNLKNNYSTIKVFDYSTGDKVDSGLSFCGLLMGDHSKCGINTMFNTGTVTGIFCNVFDSGFPPVHIPSFSWGGAQGFSEYIPEKAYDTTGKMMKRRDLSLSPEDIKIMNKVFEITGQYRKF